METQLDDVTSEPASSASDSQDVESSADTGQHAPRFSSVSVDKKAPLF